MLDTMSQTLRVEWATYATLRPFDEKRADRRAAIIATAIYNVQRGKATDPLMPLADQMIDYEGERVEEEEQLDEEATIAWAMQWAHRINTPEG